MASEVPVLKKVKVGNVMGLHARPAAQIVHIAGGFTCELKLRRTDECGKEADCRSVLAMLMLAACKDTELELSANGNDAAEAVDRLSAYFDRNFDED